MNFSFREMFFFGIGCRGGPHQCGWPAPVLDGMMRVECFSELAIGQAAQFPLPRLLQNLHDRVDQADTTAQQVEVDAKWPRIPFDVLQVMSSGEVKALGFPVGGNNHSNRDPVRSSRHQLAHFDGDQFLPHWYWAVDPVPVLQDIDLECALIEHGCHVKQGL